MFRNAKYRAKAAGLAFTISMDDIKVPEFCPVLGIKIIIGDGRGGHRDESPSLDRIHPELGYVPGNVVVVSWRVNRIKCDATVAELRTISDFYAGSKR